MEQAAGELIKVESTRYWLAAYHHVESRQGKPLHLHDRPWLLDIYCDQSHHIVCQKSSQIGMSEWLICAALAHAMNGQPIVYALPRDKDVWRVVPDRWDRLIDRVPFYRDHGRTAKKDVDQKGQKTLFGVNIYFVGSNSPANFYSVPADVLIIDELDKCDQTNLEYAPDRLESSENPYIYKIGNPTIEGYGINAAYEESDKKVYMIRCDHCGHRQALDFFANVVRYLDDGRVAPIAPADDSCDLTCVCVKCQRPIDRLAIGEWVAEFPSRDVSGYHCSKLFGDRRVNIHVLRSMVQNHNAARMRGDAALQRFYNNVLGIPYTAVGVKLTDALLAQCCDFGYLMPLKATNTIGGMDVGAKCHLHVEQLREDGQFDKIAIESFPIDIDEAVRRIQQYGASIGVVDALPETVFAKELVRRLPGWFRCFYQRSDMAPMIPQFNDIEHTVKIGKTESLDMSLARYVQQSVRLPANWRTIDDGDFLPHMIAPTRVLNETVNPPRYEWDEGGKPDHHRHADNYCMLAGMRFTYGPRLTVYE